MKVANMRGRRVRRQMRAHARQNGLPVPGEQYTVININARAGNAGRAADGTALSNCKGVAFKPRKGA